MSMYLVIQFLAQTFSRNIRRNGGGWSFLAWTQCNCLSFNTDKTFYNVISQRAIFPDQIFIDNRLIRNESHGKFLGIINDQNLTFNNHIVLLCEKVSKRIGVLYEMSKIVTWLTMKDSCSCMRSLNHRLIWIPVNNHEVVAPLEGEVGSIDILETPRWSQKNNIYLYTHISFNVI